jgi:hypothetical protein
LALADRWQGKKKAIIPALAERGASIPMFLRDIQYADISDEASFERNVGGIADAIEGASQQQTDDSEQEQSKLSVLRAEAQLLQAEMLNMKEYELRRRQAMMTTAGVIASVLAALSAAVTMSSIGHEVPSWVLGFICGVAASAIPFLASKIILSHRTPRDHARNFANERE